MPKIILEKKDIEKLIKEGYNDCEIISGLNDDTEITIRLDNLKPKCITPQVMPSGGAKEQPKKEIRLKDGTIDANASGLTLEPRKGETIPGGHMTNKRGAFRVF